ncbi:MAG: hypothetical protein ACM31C_31955 [Acidobacteriota bacterium]
MVYPRFAICIVCAVCAALAGCLDREASGRPGGSGGDRGSASVARIQGSALHARHATVACTGCHEQVGGQYLRAKSWQCQQCHASAPLGVHAAAPVDSEARECWSCHDFVGASARPTPCASCHATAQGAVRAIRPHDPAKPDEDCRTCHRAHQQPALAATKCESCHHEPVSGHDKPPIPIAGCASCHGYHEPAATASERCTNCHRQSRARVPATATFDKGHGEGHVKCVSCHRQHKFLKSEVVGCRDECHRKQVALAENRVKEHSCLGCHDQHDVKASAPRACEKCHAAKIQPKHPPDPATKTPCVGCHKPHEGPGSPLAAACSSCHRIAASDRAFHQGADGAGPQCRDCHKQHAFDLAGKGVALCAGCHGDTPFPNAKRIRPSPKHANCLGCHGDSVRHQPAGPRAACTSCHTDKAGVVRKGHATCTGCHDPHTTKQQSPCGTCHATEAGIARKDHKTCTNCHEPHTGAQKRACGSCHATEAATAPPQHQQCTNCHDQHSTLVKKPCGDCHPDRTTGIHAPVPGGCLSCHRPHGPNGPPSPPPCTTCHQDLPLLHQVPAHKDCKTCHRSHGEQPYRRRATCTDRCHTAQQGHQPDAALCIGCHTFGGVQ